MHGPLRHVEIAEQVRAGTIDPEEEDTLRDTAGQLDLLNAHRGPWCERPSVLCADGHAGRATIPNPAGIVGG